MQSQMLVIKVYNAYCDSNCKALSKNAFINLSLRLIFLFYVKLYSVSIVFELGFKLWEVTFCLLLTLPLQTRIDLLKWSLTVSFLENVSGKPF